VVDLGQPVQGERFACLGRGVGELLELGEHRLAKNRGANGVDLPVEQKGPLPLVPGVLQKIPAEQLFVEVLATSATKIA